LLDEGLFYGMKQPIMWLSKDDIQKAEVASQGRYMCNVVLSTTNSVVEFSNIDESERNGLSMWVQWHHMNGLKRKATEPKTQVRNDFVPITTYT
jgi:hypothetical protein